MQRHYCAKIKVVLEVFKGQLWCVNCCLGTISSYYYYLMPRGRKKQAAKPEEQNQQQVAHEIYQSANSHHQLPNKKQLQSDSLSEEEEQPGRDMEDEEEGATKRENTLTILTKRFTKLIKSKENFILDINQATKELGVQKRRIYDITNVLEGIGYIQKIHKNKMKWIGGTMDHEVAKEVIKLDLKIEELNQKNKEIDEEMLILTHKLKKETEEKKELNFFLEDDLKQVLQKAQGNPSSILVIKAVQGSTLEVKDNKIIIQKNSSQGQMLYMTLSKKEKDDCFSIIK